MARGVGLPVLMLLLLTFFQSVSGLGVNWGTIAVNPLPPAHVVKLLQANGIKKVKIFDADSDIVKSLAGTDIELTVAVSNDMLAKLGSREAADAWVKENVTDFSDVNIKWVAVGNEPFLAGYNNSYLNTTLPALRNVVAALAKAGHSDTVRAIIPFNADVLDDAALPSQTRFKPQYLSQLLPMLEIFNRTGAPFSVNLYPFISKYQDPDFPLDYAFFDGSTTLVDGSHTYTNAMDASLDALISALGVVGYPNMGVVLGEIGWPSDGDQFANLALAGKYNQELIKRLQGRVGTPLRPGAFFEFYMFGLLDENAKSVLPGPFERHWGIFYYDGAAKYALDLAAGTTNSPQPIKNAASPPYMSKQYCVLNGLAADRTNLSQNIAYACARSDCTPLTPGASCGTLTADQSASYAFNAYYQLQNQDPGACDFQGLAKVTTEDPTVGACRFNVGLVKYTPSNSARKDPNYYSDSPSTSGSGIHSAAGVTTLIALLVHGLLHLC